MPIVYETPRDFNRFSPSQTPVEKPAPTWGETFSSAFQMENEVSNLMEYSSHQFKNTGGGDFQVRSYMQEYDKANKTSLFESFPDAFLGVESEEEALYKISKINSENQARDVLDRAGWSGVAASITAGLASPLSFVPLVGGATRVRQAAKMASIGFATGVASEAVLQGAQETRTVEEGLIGIAASTALAGILGGLLPALKPEMRAAFEAELTKAAQEVNIDRGGVGADIVMRDPGNIAGADVRAVSRVINKTGVMTNPITQNIDQTQIQGWRELTAMLDDSALKLEGAAEGISPTPGGTVWNRTQSTYGGMLTEGIEATDAAHNKYFFEGNVPTLFPNTRAQYGGQFSKTKLSRPQFNEEVSKAIWEGFESPIPEVVEVAKALQNKVYGPILKMAQDVGLIDKDIQVVGDKAWLHRVYNDVAITRDPIEFIDIIAEDYAEHLNVKFREDFEKLGKKLKKAKTEISDAEEPAESVAALRDNYLNQLANVKALTPDSIKDLRAAVAETRALESRLANNPQALTESQLAQVRQMSIEIETKRGAKDLIGYDITKLNETRVEQVREQLRADAKDMENAGGEDLKNTKAIERELQTRIRNLSRSRAALSEQRAGKLDKIEALEDKSIAAFERVARKAQATFKDMQKWSDGKLDAELTKFRNQFADALGTFERGEEKLVKLNQELRGEAPAPAVKEFKLSDDMEVQTKENGNILIRFKDIVDTDAADPVDGSLGTSGISLAEMADGLVIRGSYLPSNARGQGRGLKMYQAAADYAASKGQTLFSDFDVSADAVKMYDKLKTKGYKVVKSPDLRDGAEHGYSGKFIGGIDGEGQQTTGFTIKIEPDAEKYVPQHELGVVEERQTLRQEKLNAIAAKLDNAENLPREEIRNAVNEGLTFLTDEMAELNLRRGKRVAALDREAAKLDPALIEHRIGQLKKRPAQFTQEFGDRWANSAAGLDVEQGAADFLAHSQELATIIKDKILGNYARLPAIDLLAHERGPELARVLAISSTKLSKFLVRDIDEITKIYVRTMGPDIELQRKLKSLDWETIQQKPRDELNGKLRVIKEDPNLTDKQKEKKSTQLQKDFDLYKNNFDATVSRIRNTRGMPANPDGVMYRGAKVVREINTMRMMGGVLAASLPDMGQPVMKFGLTRTFRDGFLPLINNFKAFKMNFREAKLANAANDIATHSRAMALSDTLDDMKRGSRFEKGVQWATNKTGLIALFDYWTVGMKAITSNVANVKIMDALATFNGAKGIMKEQEAVEYLAMIGIEGPQATQMWKQIMENEGGAKVNGVWWPNTQSWKDFESVQVYRQALYREVSRTIVQPGLERPLLSDANELGRMLYQFKSFGMASIPKIMLAGLQQKDAAVLSGSLASMGMGALSYYMWAVSTGGQAYEDMMNADMSRWADEATQRSGIFGPISEVQRITQNIPLLADYTSFSGKKTSRRPGDNLIEALLGPSFDFGQGVASIVGGLHEPTQSTIHELRKLMPFQNVFYLRQSIDAVEAAVGSNLPERRGQ